MAAMKPPLRVTAAAVLLVGALSVTACESKTSAPASQGRTVVAFTPDRPLSDDLLKQAADQLRRRAELLGLTDPQVTVGSGTVSLSVTGAIGDRATALGHQPTLEFRPVVATAMAGVSLSSQTPQSPLGTVPAQLQQQFAALDCAASGTGAQVMDPATDVVACDAVDVRGDRSKFVLGPVAVKGTDVSGSTAANDAQAGGWVVNLRFSAAGSAAFADVTGRIATQTEPANEFAIVVDGAVLSHPSVMEAITAGRAMVSGSFTEAEAKALAAQLSTGALPTELHASTPH
jgi:preprotein translocase subunit SecD